MIPTFIVYLYSSFNTDIGTDRFTCTSYLHNRRITNVSIVYFWEQ